MEAAGSTTLRALGGGFWDRPCVVDALLCVTTDLIASPAPGFWVSVQHCCVLLCVQTHTRCLGNSREKEEGE